MNIGPVRAKIQMGLLAVIILLTTVLAAIVGTTYWGFRTAKFQDRHLQTTFEQAAYLDELMTVLSRSAVVTANVQLEARYRQLSIEREALLINVRRVAPRAFQTPVAERVQEARKKLAEWEAGAFAYVGEGKAELADPLVFGETYDEQKEIYREDMKSIRVIIEAECEQSLNLRRSAALKATVVAAMILPVLIAGWVWSVGLINRYFASRMVWNVDTRKTLRSENA